MHSFSNSTSRSLSQCRISQARMREILFQNRYVENKENILGEKKMSLLTCYGSDLVVHREVLAYTDV